MKKAGTALGLKAGVVVGLVYILMLWIKFQFLGFNPFAFHLGSFITYFTVLGLLVMVGLRRRRELGGYAEIRAIFQPLFITVVIMEVMYVLFVYFYLNYINPHFWADYQQSSIIFMKAKNWPEARTQQQLDSIKRQMEAGKHFWHFAKDVLSAWIVTDSIFALIIAFLLRKKTPEQMMNNYISKQTFLN